MLLITSCEAEQYCEPVLNDNGDVIGERCWFGDDELEPVRIPCHGYYRGTGCGE